ncbi:MAG: signal peptidase II [Clostridium sp.]|uniref:signal peptidase II n=1 Tax=Clostridium sp. TaxID=1506 RepID=UPI003D6CF32F
MFIFLLVFLDQFIKLIVYTFLSNVKFNIFNNFFGFRSLLNSNHLSVFNSDFLNINININILIILNIFICLFLISLLKYFRHIKIKTTAIYTSLLLFIAGGISSTIDRIFWGGSLDYVILLGYIIDLKDIYLFVGSIIILIIVIKNLDFKKSNKKDMLVIKNYFVFIKDACKK